MQRTYEDVDNAAGYGRLSDEDRDRKNFSSESESILSQKNYIQQFCTENKINLKEYLFDDGITGQTFERQGWNELIQEIEKGKIDCVITKDLSRLGRDHSETGYYIEKFFPEHKVRYISLNDNWDSKYDSVDLILWKLAYNDVYCADISRKVKSILDSKKKAGEYVGSFAPYGYKKNEKDKHILEPDENVAHIVKEIFELAYSGTGTCSIARTMNQKGYLTPGLYSGRGKETITREKVGGIWTSGMVRRILSNQVYCGDVVQSQRRKASYKSKKCIKNEREDWIIVKDKHEALVDREVFEAIQVRLEKTSKKYNRLPGEQHLLSKLLYCKDCGHRISITWRSKKNKSLGRVGMCNFYKKYSKHNVCTPHYIYYDDLENQIIEYIKKTSTDYLNFIDTPKLIQESYKNIGEKIKQYESDKNKLLKEKDKIENTIMKIYEDYLSEVITANIYKMMTEKKENELGNIEKQIYMVDEEIKSLNKQLEQDKNKIKDIKTILNNFLNSKEITQELIHQIISKIIIGENNEVDVIFNIKELKQMFI